MVHARSHSSINLICHVHTQDHSDCIFQNYLQYIRTLFHSTPEDIY